jgi:peptidoglycan/xylan/chitin deacetylase (PgdA/CDA1 family)
MAAGTLGEESSATAGTPSQAAAAAQATGCKSSGTRIIDNGSRRTKAIALTFDDGPSRFTSRVLRLLKSAGAKATFFPIGARIKGREKLLRQELAQGMEIGNHTFTHADLGNGGPQATTEMRKVHDLIRAVTGFTPCIFRPPYRSVGNDLVPRARRLGMTTVNGDVDPSDWEQPGTNAIVQRVLEKTRNGSIIVMHDGDATDPNADRSQTVAALPRILSTLKSRGYKLVTVSRLLGYRTITR